MDGVFEVVSFVLYLLFFVILLCMFIVCLIMFFVWFLIGVIFFVIMMNIVLDFDVLNFLGLCFFVFYLGVSVMVCLLIWGLYCVMYDCYLWGVVDGNVFC